MTEPSFWFRDVPDEKRFPTLEGELETDIAIIGGGIAGISAAYFCTKAGLSSALLEMGHLGTGDSGYTTAFAAHFLDSVEQTVKAWDASGIGIELLKEVITRENISCDWKDVDEIGFTRKDDPSVFRKDYETFLRADPSLEYFEGNEASKLVGFPATAALRKKEEGQFHIRKFLFGLADRATKNGAKIFEESEVLQIEIGDSIVLKTERGSLKTKYLIVATGPPPQQFFPLVTEKLRGAITYVIHTSFPLNSATRPFTKAMFWDDEDPFHYFRFVNENEAILGGEDYFFGSKKSEKKPHPSLEAWLREASPHAEFSITNKWQGTIFYTPDKLPFLGPHPSYGENVIFLTGFAGNGMAHGFLSGEIASSFITNKKHPCEDIF